MPPAATLPGGKTIRQQTKAKDKAAADRNVVKPVLSNPLAVPWPTLPNHLQTAVLAALPQIVPQDVADYHVSRARCSRAAKWQRKRAAKVDTPTEEPGVATEESPVSKPSSLDHLVLGLNETIKALEHGIDDLRLRMMIMTDVLQGGGSVNPGQAPTVGLLPTAPSTTGPPAPEPSAPVPPLAYVLVPHLSVSPMALIDPLPTYCATYNTLLRQHAQLAKAVRSTLPRPDRYVREDAPEIKVVPLGAREAELAAMAGLRRVSAFAVRSSHPSLDALERLLPNTVLAAPRHSITLPFAVTTLRVHDDKKTVPLPAGSYAPLHVKAVHTTAPADANGRKAKRIAEVRAKRIENRTKRRAEREKRDLQFAKEIKGHKPGGRKRRLAAKEVKEAKMDVDAA